MLAHAGFTVESSDSSRAALARLGRRRFDVVVSDLPPRESYEFVRTFRREEPHVPVVLLTEAPASPDAMGAARCGKLFVLRKPGGVRQLVGTVTEACAVHRLARLEQSTFELSGDHEQALRRLQEADERLVYWGDGQAIFKLMNRLAIAALLESTGDEAGAERVREEVRAINPRLVARFANQPMLPGL